VPTLGSGGTKLDDLAVRGPAVRPTDKDEKNFRKKRIEFFFLKDVNFAKYVIFSDLQKRIYENFAKIWIFFPIYKGMAGWLARPVARFSGYQRDGR
jgi:hypothetical protein